MAIMREDIALNCTPLSALSRATTDARAMGYSSSHRKKIYFPENEEIIIFERAR